MKNLEYMRGTGGLLDYLVIAHLQGFTIGVKAMFESNGAKTFVGIRIRLAPADDSTNSTVSEFDMKEKMLSLYPNVKWASKDHKRLSLIGGAIVGIHKKDISAMHEWFTNAGIPMELFKQFQGLFPNTDLLLSSVFVDYFTEKFIDSFALPGIEKGDGNTVINMFDYKQSLYDTDVQDDDHNPDDDNQSDNHEDDE